MKQRPIFLCGFMGVGKSTVGQLLAEKLGVPFFDTDQIVMESTGKTIVQLFAGGGEKNFRELEVEAVANVIGRGPSVVALGGGALGSALNFQRISETGILFYLRANVSSLTSRLKSTAESRPLLAGLTDHARLSKITSMMSDRAAIYEKADFVIGTDGQSPEAVVAGILEKLRGSYV